MSETTIKRRNIVTRLGGWRYSENAGKTWRERYDPGEYGLGTQETESSGNFMLPNGAWSGGGPFSTVTEKIDFPTVSHRFEIPGTNGKYVLAGSFGTPCPDSLLPTDLQKMTLSKWKGQQPDLSAKGATAIAQCSPTSPNAELGTALGEIIKERRLPSIPGVHTWKDRTDLARKAGSEYLNVQFGWKPLVKDINDTRNSVVHSRDILRQYRRDSGKSVRREFGFPIERSVQSKELGEQQPCSQPAGADGWDASFKSTGNGYGPLKLTQTVKTTSKIWFVGRFRYALPNQSDSWGGIHRNAAEAEKLFGIEPTPDLIWELTPWSWAVDWFSNAGDVIHNATNMLNHGQVLQYGYVMHENIIEVTNSFTPSKEWGGVHFPPSTRVLISKRRNEGSPFGFGIGWEGLSPTQLAIAAAVGITHLR